MWLRMKNRRAQTQRGAEWSRRLFFFFFLNHGLDVRLSGRLSLRTFSERVQKWNWTPRNSVFFPDFLVAVMQKLPWMIAANSQRWLRAGMRTRKVPVALRSADDVFVYLYPRRWCLASPVQPFIIGITVVFHLCLPSAHVRLKFFGLFGIESRLGENEGRCRGG